MFTMSVPEYRTRIFKPFKKPRNRFPVWRNRFLCSLNDYEFELCVIIPRPSWPKSRVSAGGKICRGVADAGGKFSNKFLMTLRGLGEGDSWKKPEAKKSRDTVPLTN
jgi:hypothetical protein